MEITIISSRGYQINVIFVGSHYYFHSPFAGVVAIAERSGSYETGKAHFVLRAGNAHLVGGSLGGSVLFSVAEKFIKKNECKYIDTVCSFDRVPFDGSRHYINVTSGEYGK